MKDPVRCGIIGFGLSGSAFHAPFIHADPRFVLSHISSRREESRTLIAERYPQAALSPSAEGLLRDPELELIIITAPNRLHFPLAKEALEAGKHVVLEKPFTLSSAEADQLIDLARKQNRVLCAYHNRRWDGDFKTVQQLIRSGDLGEIQHFASHFDRFRPQPRDAWRESDEAGAGLLYDLGPHLIDQALLLFGKPRALEADIQKQRPGARADDYFRLRFFYPGFEAILQAGMMQEEPTPRFDIKGTKGRYIKYGLDVQEAALRAGHLPDGAHWGEEAPEYWGELQTAAGRRAVPTEAGRYQDFFASLYRAIREGAPVPVSAAAAREVIFLIEKALESRQRQQIVQLD